MEPGNLLRRLRPWIIGVGVVYVLCCLVFDFLPRWGPPDFRYTGSDPAVYVWNLGWPLAWWIYDPRNGVHAGPLAITLLLTQCVLLAVDLLAVRAGRRFLQEPSMMMGTRPVSRQRIWIARLIALAADGIQLGLFPLFSAGGAFPGDDVLDVAVAILMVALLGWHWAFLPAIGAELVPMLDLVPTWTAAVWIVTRGQGKVPQADAPAMLPSQNK